MSSSGGGLFEPERPVTLTGVGALSFFALAAGLKWKLTTESTTVTEDTITILPGSRFKAAMVLAIIADALQVIVFPLFVEGALSPADDTLDFGMAAVLVQLLGWQFREKYGAEDVKKYYSKFDVAVLVEVG